MIDSSSRRSALTQARIARKRPNGADLVSNPFRADRDRVVSSPFFSRLGGVTQVISPAGTGLLLHNRLTHSLRVAQIGRAIVEHLLSEGNAAQLGNDLGGLDADVVEAAALAHDLGHPPFGHLGEAVLDRTARHRFGLPDGFEGNAQSFRIMTTTDTRGPHGAGLDLTAATRAAVLKYPWTRLSDPDPHPRTMRPTPRGASEPDESPGTGSAKFSVYVTELDDFHQARSGFHGRVPHWQQTPECSVMDTADDIAYAIHDIEDFHRVGVLQHASVAAEFAGWLHNAGRLSAAGDSDIATPGLGHSLEELRRRLHAKDAWIVDDDAFTAAVAGVHAELVEGLLSVPFDGSVEAEQAVARFSTGWAARLVAGVQLVSDPPIRSGHVLLGKKQWHEVQVLKFTHRRFVLRRADLALHQRGQARLLDALVEELDSWMADRHEAERLPRRLHDLVELAHGEYRALAATAAHMLRSSTGEPQDSPDRIRALARGRAIIDFVASLTDSQAAAMLDALTGRSGALWSDAFVL